MTQRYSFWKSLFFHKVEKGVCVSVIMGERTQEKWGVSTSCETIAHEPGSLWLTSALKQVAWMCLLAGLVPAVEGVLPMVTLKGILHNSPQKLPCHWSLAMTVYYQKLCRYFWLVRFFEVGSVRSWKQAFFEYASGSRNWEILTTWGVENKFYFMYMNVK